MIMGYSGISWNITRISFEWDPNGIFMWLLGFPSHSHLNNSPSGSKWEWLGWVSWQMWLGVMAYWVRWFSPMPTKTSTSLVDFPLLRVILFSITLYNTLYPKVVSSPRGQEDFSALQCIKHTHARARTPHKLMLFSGHIPFLYGSIPMFGCLNAIHWSNLLR